MKLAALVTITLGVCIPGQTQQPQAVDATLFLNVRVFDGKSGALSPPSSVLVKGNVIERVSTSPLDAGEIRNVTVINGAGRVLMPGLIDAHWHAFMASAPQMLLMTADPSYLHLLAARQAEATLDRGASQRYATSAVQCLDSNARLMKV